MAIEYRKNAPAPKPKVKASPNKTIIMKGQALGKTETIAQPFLGPGKTLTVTPEKPKPAAKKSTETSSNGKKLISIRLDEAVIDGFKAAGKGWQGRVNAVLRRHLGLGEG